MIDRILILLWLAAGIYRGIQGDYTVTVLCVILAKMYMIHMDLKRWKETDVEKN